MDASASGAKIKLLASEELPVEFVLALSRDGKVRRKCQLVWQEGDMVGIRFTPK
jgi:hypothetical protein